MLKDAKNQQGTVQSADHRLHARVAVRSLAYIELDHGNGGLILNISEGGIAVQSAEMILGDHFERMRFRLPNTRKWIEVGGKVVWLGKFRKEAGIQFLSLDANMRQQIQSWAYSTAFRPEPSLEPGKLKVMWEAKEDEQKEEKKKEEKIKVEAPPVEPTSESEGAGIESMFPSEKSVPPTRVSDLTPAPPDPGVARATVKVSKPAPADPAPSSVPWSSYDLPLVRPTGRAPRIPDELPVEQPEVRDYRASTRTLPSGRRDPYASVVIDPPLLTGPGGRATHSGPRNAETPMFSASGQPIQFSGFGYQPPPFEEPSGKGWLAVAAVLVTLLGVGTVLAIGPANLRAVLAQNLNELYSRYVSAPSVSTAAPPPAAAVPEKVPTETNPLETPVEPGNANPLAGSSESPIPNSRSDKREVGDAPEVTSAKPAKEDAQPPAEEPAAAQGSLESDETAEDAAIKTRRFQMEHSQFNRTERESSQPATENTSSRQPAPPPAPVAASAPPVTQADRTFDAYAEPIAPAPTSASTGTPAGGAAASPTPAVPTGTVAISSHFHSLRGEEPAVTRERQGVVIGQLESIRQPVYPLEAERAHVEGTVQISVTVDPIGRVEIVHAISGPPMLIPAAVVAVRDWRYGGTVVNGRAVESIDDITVVFRLANSASSPR